jgi:predicted N-acyltransferase
MEFEGYIKILSPKTRKTKKEEKEVVEEEGEKVEEEEQLHFHSLESDMTFF